MTNSDGHFKQINNLQRLVSNSGGHHRQSLVGAAPDVQPQTTPAFIPIALNAAPPSCVGEQPVVAAPALAQDIRIECRRQSVSVTVHWPVSAAAQCAQMLQELLR